jgi:hypothetical protein
MVVELKTKLQLQPGQQLKVTVHSNNDKGMICKSTNKKLTTLSVIDHQASLYNPHTNLYAEQAGGVLLHMPLQASQHGMPRVSRVLWPFSSQVLVSASSWLRVDLEPPGLTFQICTYQAF